MSPHTPMCGVAPPTDRHKVEEFSFYKIFVSDSQDTETQGPLKLGGHAAL